MIQAGYRLPPGYTFEDLFKDQAELLRSEGIDPTWRELEPTPDQV